MLVRWREIDSLEPTEQERILSVVDSLVRDRQGPPRLSYERLKEDLTMQPQLEQMMEKLEHLSPNRPAEVEDFIDFLQQHDQDKRLRQDFARASEAAFAKVWDNDDDAIYDKL